MTSSTSISSLYAEHLATIKRRADDALMLGRFDHLVVPSGTPLLRLYDDSTYPFATNPQFKLWLPLVHHPECWLVYTPGNKPKLIYYQPKDYWHSVPKAPSGYWTEHFDITIIRRPEEALQHLPKEIDKCAILGDAQSALDTYVPTAAHVLHDMISYYDYYRAYKTPYEVEMMKLATQRAVRGHKVAERAFRAGASEFGIHLAYCQAVGQDATELPYNNIVALNRNAAVLHSNDYGRLPPKPTVSMLIDAGASHVGYAADITRTYAAEGHDEFRNMIEALDAAQRNMCQQVKPGHDYRQLHLDAHLAISTILKQFDLITVSAEEAVETGVSSAFFPHGIGHLIGLQVHDVAGFAESDLGGGTISKPEGHPFLRLTRVLQPGMAVTIEPGIYFIDMLLDELKQQGKADAVNWNRVEFFRPYGGIRIEDNVVCTDGEPINLTRPAFEA